MKKLIFIFFLFSFFNILAQNEATTKEVQKRNGIIYKNNIPFTGTLYEDSPHTNNECKCTLEANYTNGLLNGREKKYYSNGKIKFSGEYVLGKEQGEHKSFDSNGNVIANDKYSNGQKLSIIKINPIDEEKALLSFLKINPPDLYTNEFLKYYLFRFDENYNNYKNNEFELKRKIDNVKNEIINNLSNFNLNKIYKAKGETKLGKYSFDKNEFILKFYFTTPFNYGNGFSFRNLNMYSNSIRFSHDSPKINFINSEDYMSIQLPQNLAENLKNSLSNNNLYYTYEYKILPKVNLDKKNNIIDGQNAEIISVIFYSDKELTKQVYPVDKSNASSVFGDFFEKKNQSTKSNQGITSTKSTESNFTRFEVLEKGANEGNAESQYDLANMYFSGKEITKDDIKAFYWYKKSAENGFVNAQEELAAIYYQNKEFNNAFNWYSKAANSNHSRAQYVLGYMYLNGIGVEKNRKNAKSWFKKSCNLGYNNSCEEIKNMNAFGNALLNKVNESIKNYTPKN